MAPWLVAAEWWIRTRPIKTLKENRMLKGKLTYTTLGGLFAAIAAQVLGDGVVTAADWKELGEAAMVLLAVYGRWRAGRG